MSAAEVVAWEQAVMALHHEISELPDSGRYDVRDRPGLRPVPEDQS